MKTFYYQYQLVAMVKNWKNLKEKLKAVNLKTRPLSFKERKTESIG